MEVLLGCQAMMMMVDDKRCAMEMSCSFDVIDSVAQASQNIANYSNAASKYFLICVKSSFLMFSFTDPKQKDYQNPSFARPNRSLTTTMFCCFFHKIIHCNAGQITTPHSI